MPVPDHLKDFWSAFSASVGGIDESRFLEAFAFGDSDELADELAALVMSGAKRATTASLWSHEAEGKPLPAPGQLSIVTSAAGEPLCVIETQSVDVVAFNEVSAEFAAIEGEGDRSLESWRKGHRRFFTRECEREGRTFSEAMPVVCERFRVVYRQREA